MKKASRTESNGETPSAEASALEVASAALEAAAAVTTRARAAHEKALAELKTVRPKNVKQRQEAELNALAELNEAEDNERAAREHLAAEQRAADLAELERLKVEADPAEARRSLEALLDVALNLSSELQRQFSEIDAAVQRQRVAAARAIRLARSNGVELELRMLPHWLPEALRVNAEFSRSVPHVQFLPPATDARAIEERIRDIAQVREPVRHWHQFKAQIGSPEEVINLVLAGAYQEVADSWDQRLAAELEAGQAEYRSKVATYKVAYEEHARLGTEESRARLLRAREAFKLGGRAAESSSVTEGLREVAL